MSVSFGEGGIAKYSQKPGIVHTNAHTHTHEQHRFSPSLQVCYGYTAEKEKVSSLKVLTAIVQATVVCMLPRACLKMGRSERGRERGGSEREREKSEAEKSFEICAS